MSRGVSIQSYYSSGLLRGSEVGPLGVLLESFFIEWLVVEAGHRWLNAVSFSHVEVLSEVLISAPPVGVDHADSLISSNLMEVGVSNVVLLSISWESSIGVWGVIVLVDLSDVPLPLSDHTLFLLLGQKVKNEGLVQMPNQEDVDNSNSVLVCKGSNFPEGVTEWILEEPSEVLEGSPFLGHVSWLLGLGNELSVITIGLLGQGSE